MTHSRLLMLAAAILFVIAAFAFGGDPLANIPAWSWMAGALAAWALSAVV